MRNYEDRINNLVTLLRQNAFHEISYAPSYVSKDIVVVDFRCSRKVTQFNSRLQTEYVNFSILFDSYQSILYNYIYSARVFDSELMCDVITTDINSDSIAMHSFINNLLNQILSDTKEDAKRYAERKRQQNRQHFKVKGKLINVNPQSDYGNISKIPVPSYQPFTGMSTLESFVPDSKATLGPMFSEKECVHWFGKDKDIAGASRIEKLMGINTFIVFSFNIILKLVKELNNKFHTQLTVNQSLYEIFDKKSILYMTYNIKRIDFKSVISALTVIFALKPDGSYSLKVSWLRTKFSDVHSEVFKFINEFALRNNIEFKE